MPFRFALLAVAVLGLQACAMSSNDRYVSPVDGEVSKAYGPQANGFHHGVELRTKGGSRVEATLDGRVVKKGHSKTLGRYVIIDHGAGLQTTYAGLSKVGVMRGDYVNRGEKIGRVGKRKDPSADLHFQMRIAKKSIDPMPILAAAEMTRAEKKKLKKEHYVKTAAVAPTTGY